MRRVGLAVTLLLALVVVSVSAAASKPRARPPVCNAARHHIVAADAQAEVYEAQSAIYRELFACAYSSRHGAYALGVPPKCSASGCGGVEHETLGGAMVAYEEFASGEEGYWHVVVRDLRTGHVLHRAASTGSFTPEIVVKSDGAVAWSAITVKPTAYAIVTLDKTGTHVVAEGPNVVPTSLALAGSTLYWTQDGKPMSAPIN
jgi:hypothetical protein